MRFILLVSAMLLALLNPQASFAKSCGFPPVNSVTIPDGQTANREQIQQAVAQVQNFADKMDEYLNCLDVNRESMLMFMNKDQQVRWNEDYDMSVETLSNLQNSLNEQIRIFNSKVN